MEVLDAGPEMIPEWDDFVRTHPLASYGHLSAQFALADASGVRNASLVVRDGGRIAGLLPLFVAEQRSLRLVPVRELTSGAFFPAGSLISSKLQGKAEARVAEALMGAVRVRIGACNADRARITHPTIVGGQPAIGRFGYSPLLHHGYEPRHGVGLLLDLTQTPEQLAAGRRSGCRQSVNKAQASGVIVEPLRNRAEWMACDDINHHTMGELAYTPQQLGAIWDNFIAPGHAVTHAVRIDGRAAAVTVTIHCNGSAYYWIGLNRRPAPLAGAGHLALWTAILDARERGCRYFELGSLDFENPRNIGISQFKQSFGGTPCQIISAQLEAKPVKTAAIALGDAVLASVRERTRGRRAPTTASEGASSRRPVPHAAGVA